MKCTGIKLNKTLHIKEKKNTTATSKKKRKKRNKQLEEKI